MMQLVLKMSISLPDIPIIREVLLFEKYAVTNVSYSTS